MLVLSRKKNESIVINNDITIVVVEIRGDKVRLGVEAPKEVPVHRREVYDAIHRNDADGGNTITSYAGTDLRSILAALHVVQQAVSSKSALWRLLAASSSDETAVVNLSRVRWLGTSSSISLVLG